MYNNLVKLSEGKLTSYHSSRSEYISKKHRHLPIFKNVTVTAKCFKTLIILIIYNLIYIYAKFV